MLPCAAAPQAAGRRLLQSPARQNAKSLYRCVSREEIGARFASDGPVFLQLRLPRVSAGLRRRPCAFSLPRTQAPLHRSRSDRSRLSFPSRRNSAPPSCIHGAASTNTRTSRHEFRCDALAAFGVMFREFASLDSLSPLRAAKFTIANIRRAIMAKSLKLACSFRFTDAGIERFDRELGLLLVDDQRQAQVAANFPPPQGRAILCGTPPESRGSATRALFPWFSGRARTRFRSSVPCREYRPRSCAARANRRSGEK